MDAERPLWRDPVFVVFVLGTFLGGLMIGDRGVVRSVVNYVVLLPLYVGMIYLWTRKDAPLSAEDIARPARWREVVALVAPWVIVIALAMWAWYVRRAPVEATSLPPAPVPVVNEPAIDLLRLLRARANNAISSTLKVTLPTVLIAAVAGMSWRRLGLAPRYLGLGAALVALGIANAVVLSVTTDLRLAYLPLFSVPSVIIPLFLLQLLINAIPEELHSRGLTMQRWLALTRSPGTAIAVSTIFFAVTHVPFMVLRGADPLSASLDVLFTPQPTGIIWAYLFYRTRSLWPGLLWHASFTVLGVVFL